MKLERRTGALVVAVLLDGGRKLFKDVGGALFQGLRVGEQLLNGRLVGAFLCGIVRLNLENHVPDAVGELEVFRLDTGVQAVDLAARGGEDELGEHGVIGIVENAQALELGQLACGVQNVIGGFTGVGGRGVLQRRRAALPCADPSADCSRWTARRRRAAECTRWRR